ncbi:MAG: hypothetical protein PSX71_14140 [bacterium]|nr:hypothetical protein [bacterium]
MKTQRLLLTPLAFAVAASLSMGVHADGDGHHDNYLGASASINDEQKTVHNGVVNQGTENTATIQDSLGGASGNVGVNVAAGDNNQQANAAAIATADVAAVAATSDALFVFGPPVPSAQASINVEQKAYGNDLTNYSVPNNATLNNAAGGVSGNLGINIAAGNYNQQKNNMTVAASQTAYRAGASVSVEQTSAGNTTANHATLSYENQPISLTLNATGTYSGTSDQIGNVYPDMWSGSSHPGGTSTGHFDLDTATQGGTDLNGDGGALAFNEAGNSSLSGTVTGYLPVVSGFSQPVVNNALLTNSLGGVSGNIGVNIAAGGGNQQSNSLSIAAGCHACTVAATPASE